MASVEKLIAGATSTFTSLMTTELNSLATGNAVMGSTAVDNASNLDLFAEFSFKTGGSITPTGAPFIALYLYPLNGDASTYGDGRFGSATAAQPYANYYWGYLGLVPSAGTQTGSFAIPGTPNLQIPLPRGSWKPVIYNASGVTLTSSGNILYYRTTNLNLNG